MTRPTPTPTTVSYTATDLYDIAAVFSSRAKFARTLAKDPAITKHRKETLRVEALIWDQAAAILNNTTLVAAPKQ